MPRWIATLRLESGDIILGVRHFDELMVAQIKRGELDSRRATQGFIDARGKFLEREAAWERADWHQQILRNPDWSTGVLHSEHLY